MKARLLILFILVGIALALLTRQEFRSAAGGLVQRLTTRKTIADRLKQYGEVARNRVKPYFTIAQASYPPERLLLAGFKEENDLQVYAADANGPWRLVRSFPILAASGGPGPKLREGDRQVPEGIYSIESLNPNSQFHLSLRIGYPNEFDREQARREGRIELGGDIMIHGGAGSIGCLAMGDEAAEDLFVLAADTGLRNISVILSSADFRRGKANPADVKLPLWTDLLYAEIRAKLRELPLANQ